MGDQGGISIFGQVSAEFELLVLATVCLGKAVRIFLHLVGRQIQLDQFFKKVQLVVKYW